MMFDRILSRLVGALLFTLNYVKLQDPAFSSSQLAQSCDSGRRGYECQPELSRNWGQYSPWFSVPSEIPADIPRQCSVVSVQILSRHGGRYPTLAKSDAYRATVEQIHEKTHKYSDSYSFVQSYEYSLSSDDLTAFGEQEMVNSGTIFFDRYRDLSISTEPFVRASGQNRVIVSAQKWLRGFLTSKGIYGYSEPDCPYPMLVVSEEEGSNNTLSHGLCKAFENGTYSHIRDDAEKIWSSYFIPSIQKRINANLLGAGLNLTQTVNFMDLCPYETMASPTGRVSPFCNLFSPAEWQQYNHLQSLNKYYGHGAGNPLGPTNGVGFVNEVIARLTNSPVVDHTSTNRTLDGNPATFPLDRAIYVDFSHDNDMMGIFFALGLYNSTEPLPKDRIATDTELQGYSSAKAVPFAARVYIEKLNCADSPSEAMVRILVNDRVIPLKTCGGDELGRCSLRNFIDSLTFARNGGLWDQC